MSILCSGSFVADILAPDLPAIGPPGSLTYAPNGIHLSPGGHSSNVAINLAQLEAKNIHAVGAIGRDEIGGFLITQLKNRGVTPIPQIIQNSTTAKNIALLVKGEDRRYIAELTANSMLTSFFLKEAIKKIDPNVFYQGTLGGLPDIEKNLSQIFQTLSSTTINLLDVIMPTNGWQYLYKAAPQIDILHANQLEAEHLTGEKDPVKASKKLTKLGIHMVVISDAHKDIIASTKEHIITIPSYKVKQRDPTGAGDALCAGIITHIQKNKITRYQMTEPETITELLLTGQAAGAACVTGLGATTNVTKENLERILTQKETIRNQTTLKKL